MLTAVATSQTDNTVQNSASANVSITARQSVSAEFDPASAELPAPWTAGTGRRGRNTGNVEDAYAAIITATSGPLAAELIRTDRQPTQTIEIFRLPAQASGLLPLDAELLQAESDQITVTVTSLSTADQRRCELPREQRAAGSGCDPDAEPIGSAAVDGALWSALAEFYHRRRRVIVGRGGSESATSDGCPRGAPPNRVNTSYGGTAFAFRPTRSFPNSGLGIQSWKRPSPAGGLKWRGHPCSDAVSAVYVNHEPLA